ncbi:hypothetical protein [Posidoniimonas polymericola]|uniref:hypothetical protein n=1 Tax=Posidoniimonas polymericola TaxID=2528002 RepID=UPI0011B5CB0A|nr:hypothetical protein [Posidoniimonas polymericola]
MAEDSEDYHDDTALRWYLNAYYPHLFSDEERCVIAIAVLRNKQSHRETPIDHAKDDIESYINGSDRIRQIIEGDIESYLDDAARRIISQKREDVFINRCPACQRIVRTPVAKQCLWCGHDWH